jgi:hypothetical protein
MIVFISSILPDEPRRANMRLFYNRYQLILDLTEQDGMEYKIQEGTKISSFSYDTNEGYKNYYDLVTNHLQPWKGYGTFEAESFE